MISKEMMDMILLHDKILIIGHPKSGKSTLFNHLAEYDDGQHFLLRTDDYIEYDYEEQLYVIMDELDGKKFWMVEGIQGYRLLRKYAQTGETQFKPAIIVVCESLEEIEDKHKRMAKGLDKIMDDYFDLEKNIPDMCYYRWGEK